MPPASTLNEWNRRDIVADYAERDTLTAPESAIINRHAAHIDRGRVLDLGVGAGRTVPFLAPQAKQYVGVDYAPKMVCAAQLNHPGVSIREGDARKLDFADESFSFVLFSYNGIDYVHISERLQVLREVFRVLRPDGVFAFSSHNLRAPRPSGLGSILRHRPTWTLNPVRLGVRACRAARDNLKSVLNYTKLSPQQIFSSSIAMVNDGAHLHSLLTCYVDPSFQVQQLEQAGFAESISLFGMEGHQVTDKTNDEYVYFVAQKAS